MCTGAFRFLTGDRGCAGTAGFPKSRLPEWWNAPPSPRGNVRARPVIGRFADQRRGRNLSPLNELMQFRRRRVLSAARTTPAKSWTGSPPLTAPLSRQRTRSVVALRPSGIRAALDAWKREPAPARDVIRMALSSADLNQYYPAGVEVRRSAHGEGWIGELLGKLQAIRALKSFRRPQVSRHSAPVSTARFLVARIPPAVRSGRLSVTTWACGKTHPGSSRLLGNANAPTASALPTLLICSHIQVVSSWRKEAARFVPRPSGPRPSRTGAQAQTAKILGACRAPRGLVHFQLTSRSCIATSTC